jgi:hypothetical protein
VKYSCCSDSFKDKDVFKKVNLPDLRVKDNGFAISNGSSKLKRLNFYECNYQYRFDTITYLQKKFHRGSYNFVIVIRHEQT